MDRRRFLAAAAAGTVFVIGGCGYARLDEEAHRKAASEVRPDGRERLPPGQYLLRFLKPMGGDAGEAATSRFRLRVHGEVEHPLELDFAALLRLPQVEQTCDVHCVTGWSCLDRRWMGVRVSHLAELAGVKDSARHVIFEAAHGYTANVPREEALAPNVLVAHNLDGDPLAAPHGAPVRALVPDLYFWKSAKWLTGIRFSRQDKPGYWETRGYHNHGDPWLEERYG